MDSWEYSGENNQEAFINYENGLQKMIISVGLERGNNDGAVWLFPVPSEPTKVKIDVITSLPRLDGEEIYGKAEFELDDAIENLVQFHLSPFSFYVQSNIFSGSFGRSSLPFLGRFIYNVGYDHYTVEVFEHIEKNGITSEVITAKTAEGLYEYLKSKGLKIESGSIKVLDEYIGKEYSFVVSWITSPKKETISVEEDDDIANQRGLFVTFPTKDMYFPLLPTSVYGSKVVPATVRVMGHVTPKVFQDIKGYTEIKYYFEKKASFSDDVKNFYNGKDKSIKYTKIEINSPSEFFTDDLWITAQAPIKTWYATFIVKYPGYSVLILNVLSSILAGMFAGFLVFKELRGNFLKLGMIGLSNVISVLGVLVTTILVSTKNKNESVEPLLVEIKQRGYLWKRRAASIILWLITIPSLIHVLFLLPLRLRYLHFIPFFIFILCVLILVSLIIFFLIKNIKPEDKNLFEQLKLAGYSSWSFQPKDNMKYIFVLVFSVSFVGILYGLYLLALLPLM